MALIIGPMNVGKSLLVKRLIEGKDALPLPYNSLPPTLPTTGMGLQDIDFNKKQRLSIREIGGDMAPIWSTYYNESDSIIFVADSSNSFQYSCALIQIIELLKYISDKPNKRVLLVLNKCDLDIDYQFCNFMEDDLLYYMNNSPNKCRLTIIRASCADCRNLDLIKDWILKCK